MLHKIQNLLLEKFILLVILLNIGAELTNIPIPIPSSNLPIMRYFKFFTNVNPIPIISIKLPIKIQILLP